MRFLRNIHLPLLARELTEQSAQARTYLLRVGYACLSFVAAFVMFSGIFLRSPEKGFEVLGQGREVYRAIFQLQFWGILLFMPALTAGSIAQEKERNCLEVLLLTRLSPWTIVCEKLLSRLVPMFSFLLLSLPLMAFAYTLGGVSRFEFWSGFVALVLLAAQVGAIAVMCSAWCRSTVSAFVATYGAILCSTVFCFCTFSGLWFRSDLGAEQGTAEMAAGLFTSVLVTIPALMFATGFVVTRANVRPKNVLLKSFRGMDRVFDDWNRFTGNIVLIKDETSLPKKKPISWRETTKKSLGTVRYLFRVLVVILVPLLTVLVWFAGERFSGSNPFAGILSFLWIISIPIVAVKSATVISGERSAQTLDVLLTTPLRGAEIISQKRSGILRLMIVLSIPMLTTIGFELYWEKSLNRISNEKAIIYTVAAVGSILLYLSLVSWVAFWIGLVVRSQVRAVLIVLALLIGWMFLPAFVEPWSDTSSRSRSIPGMLTVAAVHPTTFVLKNEEHALDTVTIIANFGVHAGVIGGLCVSCLTWSDKLLGRAEGEGFFSRKTAEPEAAD